MAIETMVSYRDLSELKFDKLDTAVSKWNGIKSEFHDLSAGGGKGQGFDVPQMQTAAEKARWQGTNADLSKPFVVKVAREFHDAAREVKSIHKAIQLARQRMHKHQEDLKKVVEDIRGDGMLVAADGSVQDSQCYADEGKQKASQQKVDAAKADIEKVLKAAALSQHDLADGLRLLVKDKHDFSGVDYSSYEDVQKVVGEADAVKAAALAEKLTEQAANGDKISMTQLDAFNDLAELQHNNPAFAERLATTMGPKDTLLFWRVMSGDGPEVMTKSDYGKQMTRLRDNLGMTLATASRSNSREMTQWKKDMIKLGGMPVSYPDLHAQHDPVGFQVMSSLMGKGKFDTKFLQDYEQQLRAYDKKIGDEGRAWNNAGWQGTDLDPSSLGRSSDPMTGLLKAAAHNPEFATELFKNKDTADYYLDTREYLPEDPYLEDGKNRAAEALSDAIYAGGSGLNPDDPNATYAEHTDAQNQAFNNTFDRLAAQKDDMMPELRKGMADLLGNHGDDVHATMSAPLGDGPLDEAKLMELSKQISRTPEGYASLNQAMNHAIVDDIVTEKDAPAASMSRTGRTIGFLEEARHKAIADATAADQKSAGWKSFWSYFAVAELSTLPPIAPVSAHVANVAFTMSKAWTEDEQARIAADGTQQNIDASKARTNQLRNLSSLWYEQNTGWADQSEDYNSDYLRKDGFGKAADHGKLEAERILGKG